MTPAEAIAQRAAGVITTDQMMNALLHWQYTFGRCAQMNGIEVDAWIRGDWDDVTVAFILDQLTEDEFERVANYATNQKRQHDQRHRPSNKDELRSGRKDPHWPADPEVSTDGLHSAIPAAESAEDVMRVLATTAFTAKQVAAGLGIGDEAVEQMRLDRALWAIQAGRSWRFPAAQFDVDTMARQPIRQVRGLAQVLVALPADLHPVAIGGFLSTPQPDLWNGRALTPLAWLRSGGAIEAVVRAAQAADWYSR